jgi:tRNA(Met) cytidine acetyltransferase
MLSEVARTLHAEATATNERRMLVLHGARDATIDAARTALVATDLLSGAESDTSATLVSDRDDLPMERVSPRRTETLLGSTRTVVVYDAHAECRPNALGRTSGVVDGGGLLVLCTPSLDEWSSRRDDFDAGLAVPPFDPSEVTGHFRTRLVDLLFAHRGIAIVDVDHGIVEDDGRTHPAPRHAAGHGSTTSPPTAHRFPAAAYEACLTDDQAAALAASEALLEAPNALVLEADRGRGKSSAVGLAAACLATRGDDVLVTAPGFQNAAEIFARSRGLLDTLDSLHEDDESTHRLDTTTGGSIRFDRPPAAAESVQRPDAPDVVIVDEAAAIPVRLLDALLTCDRIAFATTVHGYEGAGRGFDVRFRSHLATARHEVADVTLATPIRYASGDPIEVWAFRALALDATPAVDPLVENASPETAEYETLTPSALLADETLLREAFGLLVTAHYRTEPNDLARLLDAPNLTARALFHDGHVAAVALLAREGGLGESLRANMYEGGRVKGNMLPDVLTSQLRDEDAAIPVGYRVMRIATHPACRNRGLGSHLLAEIRSEVGGRVDWLGVGYGATSGLVDFWRTNGYSTVHVATTRNDTSGEYSAIMLDPTSHRGTELHDRHADWFARRIPGVLGDALRDLDPDVARACLRACDATPALALTDADWRLVAACAYGPAMYAVDPDPFARLVVHHLVAGDPSLLDARQERLLVATALQHRPWGDVVDHLDYHSHGSALRAFGRAFQPLVDAYGTDAAHEERSRHAP